MSLTLRYEQSTGRLLACDGSLLAQCYSGLGASKNVPGDQNKHNQGPIPQGVYTLSGPEAVNGGPHGPYVIRLTPYRTNQMFGRSGFLIHADSIHHPGAASEGCIVALGGLEVRKRIWAQHCKVLTVVA